MKKTTCYCCEKPAIGQGDHVPPMSLFPKGAFSNMEPMIVPSCAEHNQERSQSDEYLKFVLTSSSDFASKDALGGTVRGLTRHIENNSQSLHKFGIERNGQEVFIDRSAPINFELLNEALKKVARGIYFHHSNGEKKLLGTLTVLPIFLGINILASPEVREDLMLIHNDTKTEMEKFKMLGAFQEIFSYQVIENNDMIIINMKFYVEKIISVICAKT